MKNETPEYDGSTEPREDRMVEYAGKSWSEQRQIVINRYVLWIRGELREPPPFWELLALADGLHDRLDDVRTSLEER